MARRAGVWWRGVRLVRSLQARGPPGEKGCPLLPGQGAFKERTFRPARRSSHVPCHAHTHGQRERERVRVRVDAAPFHLKKKKNSTGNFHFALAAGSAAATWRTPAAAGKTVAEEHRCWGRGEVVVGIVLCEEASRWRRLQRPGRCHVNDNERSAAKWLPILHTALSLFSRAPRASLSLLPVRDQPED